MGKKDNRFLPVSIIKSDINSIGKKKIIITTLFYLDNLNFFPGIGAAYSLQSFKESDRLLLPQIIYP